MRVCPIAALAMEHTNTHANAQIFARRKDVYMFNMYERTQARTMKLGSETT